MIVRNYIICDICNTAHTLRIAVGADSTQHHSFQCRNCGETIEVEMRVDYQKLSTKVVPITNCQLGSDEGHIVNLSPMHVIPDHLQGQDFVFPGMLEGMRIIKEAPSLWGEMEANSRTLPEIMAERERRGGAAPGISHEWEFAKRVWSLTINGREDVCADYIERNHVRYRFDQRPSAREVIYGFCVLLGKRRAAAVFEALVHGWRAARQISPEECEKLRLYIVGTHLNDMLSSALPVISEFMDNHSEFTQISIYHEYGIRIPDGYMPSSFGFDRIKQFYGNAFELMASMELIPACVNNIANGRAFDRFQTMDLAKYLDTDKAGRHNCFASNEKMAFIADCINAQVRNGSHHGNMRFNPKSGQISYRPNRTGGLKYIKYTDYLIMCISITQSICGLLATALAYEASEPTG